MDAQQKAMYIEKRSLRRGELLKLLAQTQAGAIRVVLELVAEREFGQRKTS